MPLRARATTPGSSCPSTCACSCACSRSPASPASPHSSRGRESRLLRIARGYRGKAADRCAGCRGSCGPSPVRYGLISVVSFVVEHVVHGEFTPDDQFLQVRRPVLVIPCPGLPDSEGDLDG